MNTKVKNIIVTTGLLSCAFVLAAIVSIGITPLKQQEKNKMEYVAKVSKTNVKLTRTN